MVLFAACGRGIDTTEAVRQGVLDYLATRSNLNIAAMNVDVTAVSFRQDDADATVSFTPKGGAPGKGMAMHYNLTRKSGKWVVKERAETGANPHGADGAASGALPPGHPPAGGSPAPK
jgi:hypothetical protein